jgi:hypothetical protein
MQGHNHSPEESRSRLLREYLQSQRDELDAYLAIMEQQAAAISAGAADRLARYSCLEKASIARLEKLNRAAGALLRGRAGGWERSEPALKELRSALGALGKEALARNAANRSALTVKMAELRRDIENRPQRRGSAHRPSPYAGIARPSLVDLHT